MTAISLFNIQAPHEIWGGFLITSRATTSLCQSGILEIISFSSLYTVKRTVRSAHIAVRSGKRLVTVKAPYQVNKNATAVVARLEILDVSEENEQREELRNPIRITEKPIQLNAYRREITYNPFRFSYTVYTPHELSHYLRMVGLASIGIIGSNAYIQAVINNMIERIIG